MENGSKVFCDTAGFLNFGLQNLLPVEKLLKMVRLNVL